MFDLTGKRTIVTGGASGIGFSIARLFADRGAEVFILDHDGHAAQAAAAQIRDQGNSASGLPCDVSARSTVESAFADVCRGGLDILVNNAGIADIGTVLTTEDAAFERVFEVNVKGVFLCTQAALKPMLAGGGGVILNIASIASLIALNDRFAYSMSKGAVLAMTRSVAIDYVKQGIRCNCICPARIHTPFVDRYLQEHYPGEEAEVFAKLSAYQPVGRMGTADEVAALALYLCSDESSFVTGAAYPIDGGVTMQ